MEYVEGETLRAVVERGPLPLPRLLDLVGEIADGVREQRLRELFLNSARVREVLAGAGTEMATVPPSGAVAGSSQPAPPALRSHRRNCSSH